MKRLASTLFVLFAGTALLWAQDGYEIELKLKGVADKDIYLAHRFGKKIYVDDTTRIDAAGKGVFKGQEPLIGGMYVVYISSQEMFDIIIGIDQHFSLKNNTEDLLDKLSFSGSEINDAFLEYRKYLKSQREKAGEVNKKLKAAQEGEDEKEIEKHKAELEEINDKVFEKREAMIEEYPNTFLATFLTATKDIEVPDPPKDVEGNITDSTFSYRYYKNHYWDNFDLGNPRLLYTSLYEPKLKRYFTQVIPQAPDSLKPELDWLIAEAKANKETYRFVLGTVFNHYNRSKVMGMDEVFVHVADYYLRGETDWNDSSYIADLRERVQKIKPNLLGKTAANFTLPTIDNKYFSLHDVEADYTVLFFYEPDCGHCNKSAPIMREVSENYTPGQVRFVGFYTQVKPEEWKEFVDEKELHSWVNVWDPYNKSNFRFFYNIYSTPTIYVLDKDKKIVAKRIGAEQTEEVLENLLDDGKLN